MNSVFFVHVQVSVELLKVVKRGPIELYRNAFLNIALPLIVLSEPAPAQRTQITEGVSYTLWDKWEVQGHANYTLKDFLKHFLVSFLLMFVVSLYKYSSIHRFYPQQSFA